MNLRRQYLNHRRFQWDFALRVFLTIFGSVLVCNAFLLIYLQFAGNSPAVGSRLLFSGEIWLGFLWRTLLLAFVVCVFSILFSHRIAGPMRRLQNLLQEAAAGGSQRAITLRRKDYFHQFAAKLNQLQSRSH